MSKQRKNIPHYPGEDPTLDHAAGLVQEFTEKLRASSRRLRAIDGQYIVEAQRWRRRYQRIKEVSPNVSPQEQQIWYQLVQAFQSKHDEAREYLGAITPQALKLAQHVSQLITHGTSHSIVQIELSLRVTELESAIKTARSLINSSLMFVSLD